MTEGDRENEGQNLLGKASISGRERFREYLGWMRSGGRRNSEKGGVLLINIEIYVIEGLEETKMVCDDRLQSLGC